jgi:hypothetical protein
MTETRKKYYCENCGKELNKDEVCEIDGTVLCRDCYDEEEDFRAIEEAWI